MGNFVNTWAITVLSRYVSSQERMTQQAYKNKSLMRGLDSTESPE